MFLETGIDGSYEFSNPTVTKTWTEEMFLFFDDVEITVDGESSTIGCEMCIDGKVFMSVSYFLPWERRRKLQQYPESKDDP